ncbi:helix-turn-helix domain-containing protein [Modestobacter versicolor]|uniref:Transcriptional regulator with XRE-family HTH domain n=1 Tax=Modestobacter versicolor TaxID=429133 RepID=A0A839Y7S3_9ACTN|nr:helix-turn-helix transcriptional regulator [Modestobacter versicolor]MBB3676891.1 transcriptional regulator with XRE-family HTH domain [Modestobacter versicolor]
MDPFPLAGLLRRIRRTADCSQRELAERIGASKATVAAAESGTRDLPASVLARAAQCAGARLVVLCSDGAELLPMDPDAVRDAGWRQFPAHLDTRHGDEDWWGGPHRPRTRQPRYTFDRDRLRRDGRRSAGLPDDHHVPQPGDSLADRAAARRLAALERRREEQLRRPPPRPSGPDWGTGCTCPPGCEYLEGSNEDLGHAEACACRCDV